MVGPDEAVGVAMERRDTDLRVEVEAPFHDDPPPVTEDVWLYEVVELMLVGADDAYLEVELSPHGRSLVLFLRGERHVVRRSLTLDFCASIDGDRWHGVAKLPFEWLPADTARLNAFAIHGLEPNRRYLAWKPTLGRGPDFHRLRMFGRLGDCIVESASPPSMSV